MNQQRCQQMRRKNKINKIRNQKLVEKPFPSEYYDDSDTTNTNIIGRFPIATMTASSEITPETVIENIHAFINDVRRKV